MSEQRLPNRWLIACAGVIMNVCVGTTYAWSVFTKPLTLNSVPTNTSVCPYTLLRFVALTVSSALVTVSTPLFVTTT